jgi:EF-hand domain-containing protein 1
VFIKRHRVVRDDGTPFEPSAFAVGETVTMYGRTFFLVDADSFTREWFQENQGVEQATPLAYPDDPVDAYRATFSKNTTRKS